MDNLPEKRPPFIESWLEDVRDDVQRYGKKKLIPWFLAICVGIGWGASQLVNHQEFWNHPEVSVIYFTAAVTINGLLLALSWGSFAKIYEIAGRPELAKFLKENNLLRSYMHHVDYIHVAQILALACSGASLVISVTGELAKYPLYVTIDTVHDWAFSFTIASTIYALRYALGAVTIMQDLVWYSSSLPTVATEHAMRVHEGGKSGR